MHISSPAIRRRTNQKLSKRLSAGFAERLAAQQNEKSPSPPNAFAQWSSTNNLFGLRDRALLLLGFAGAFRRSELVGLDVSDLKEVPAGLLVQIRHSKTDQEHLGQIIGIPRGNTECPIKAVKAWLKASGIIRGPVFRSISKAGRVSNRRLVDRMVAELVKFYAKRIDLDPRSVSAHSLRAGFLTSAAQTGASVFKLMDVSRHKSVDTLSGYIRHENIFDNHAGTRLL